MFQHGLYNNTQLHRKAVINTEEVMIKKNNEEPIIDVGSIARLARLEINNSSLDEFQKDMESIVKYVDLLAELNLDGIEPTAHSAELRNIWREDISGESFSQEEMLKNAPLLIEDELIAVPQVVSEEGSC